MTKKRKQRKVNIDGKRISINYYTEKEFQEKYKSLLAKEEQRKSISFKKIAEEWQESHDIHIQKYTQECYKAPIKDVISWFNGKLITEIKPKDIQMHIDEMAQQGFARQTINLRKIVLNQIFNYAYLNEYISSNPVQAIRVPKNSSEAKRELPESSAIKIIFDNINHEFGFYPFLAAITGGRRGEILALTKDDFDFKNNTVRFNKVCILSDNTKPIIRQGTKSESGNRVVPILSVARPILKDFVDNCECEYIINKDGKPLLKYQFDKLYAKYKRDTGINFSSHQLRHLYATLGIESGIQVIEMQKLLGHSKASTTEDIYVHYREQQAQTIDKRISSKLNKIISKEKLK